LKSLRIVVVCFAVVVLFAFAAAAALARTADAGKLDSSAVVETPSEEAERVERERVVREERERREKQEWEEPTWEPGPGQCECPDPGLEHVFLEGQRIMREERERAEAEAVQVPGAPAPTAATDNPPLEAPGPPETAIAGHPARVTSRRRATFAFTASQTPAAFECKLDGGAFQPCGSDFTTKKLKAMGKHTLQVRANNSAGEVDATPATYRWRVRIAS
jgi:hypothetical protein